MMPGAKEPYRFRRLLWIGLVGVVSLLCAGLGAVMFWQRQAYSATPGIGAEEIETAVARLASPTPPESTQSVQITLLPYLNGNMLTVEGFTDLPPRSLLLYSVSEVSPYGSVDEGTLPVLDGRFARQIDLTGWHAGTIAIWVGFQTQFDNGEKQPDEVIERFGEMGEFLYGANVTETNGLKRVEVTTTLEFSPK